MEEHELKNCEKLLENVFFLHVVLSKHWKYHCFGWFALRTGNKKMKKTVVFAVHLKPLGGKTSQNAVFLHMHKKTV